MAATAHIPRGSPARHAIVNDRTSAEFFLCRERSGIAPAAWIFAGAKNFFKAAITTPQARGVQSLMFGAQNPSPYANVRPAVLFIIVETSIRED